MSHDPVVLSAPPRPQQDHNTVCVGLPSLLAHRALQGDPALGARSLKEGGRLASERARGPSVAVVAAIGDQVVSTGLLPARMDRINTAIVGRHSKADFRLPDEPGVSLRHLALIVRPAARERDIRFRVLDLRTGAGFVDEDDRRLESIEVEGPAFLWCGAVRVYLFPVGDGFAWPEQTCDALAVMPDRIYFQEVTHDGLPSPVPQQLGRPGPARSLTVTGQTMEFMIDRDLLVDSPEDLDAPDALAVLRLDTGESRGYLPLTADMLARGVLLGRYGRCESTHSGLRLPRDNTRLSRVHALIVADGDAVWLIDTASTNGIRVGGEARRAVRLPRDGRLEAELAFLKVRWTPRPTH